jgi:FkbM family methyltransferase
MLPRNLSTYAKELSYCFSATRDMRSCATLLWHTACFHVMNAYNRRDTKGRLFVISLEIGHGYNRELCLRPFAGDLFVLYEVFMLRSYFVPESMLPPDDVRIIVDCGANVGITSLFLASRYPRAKIFSIEPHPENFELLTRNTSSEARIVPINAAVVGQPRTNIRFSTSGPAWGNKITQDDADIEVPAISIAELCKNYGLEHIDLLKVDIEGGEEEIFANADFLPRVRFGIIELHGSYSQRLFDVDIERWHFVTRPPRPELGLKMLTFAPNPVAGVVRP